MLTSVPTLILKRIRFFCLALGTIALTLTGLFYFIYYVDSPKFSIFFSWYAVTLALLSIPIIRQLQTLKLLEATRGKLHHQLTLNRKKVDEQLQIILRPRMDSCEGLPAVCQMAAEIIIAAHKNPQHDQRYVTFYGAASLAIPEGEIEEFGSVGGSGQQSPYQKYLGALDAATGDKIRMRRYVKLFTLPEFSRRSNAVQREYINWLKGQYNMLFRNPNYMIINVVRAPYWGSKIARIITHDALMEITGDGDAAIRLTDHHLCDTIRRSARETVVGTKEVKNKPEYYGQSKACEKKAEDFKRYFMDIERSFSPRDTGDEEADNR
jgi:hypothetical protein